jgi:hypothetical protein
VRNISFAMTTQQFLAGAKTVTRRWGWETLKPGTVLCAVRQQRGLKRGERVERLGYIQVIDVRREPLDAITLEDVRREGFPTWTVADFIEAFLTQRPAGKTLKSAVTVITFKKVDKP